MLVYIATFISLHERISLILVVQQIPYIWMSSILRVCSLSLVQWVQLLSCVWLVATPWTTACQTSLSIIDSWSLFRLVSIESVMPSNHLILCHPLLLLSISPSIRVFSNESVLHIRWPKYWSFSFSISPSMNIQGWFKSILFNKSNLILNPTKLN